MLTNGVSALGEVHFQTKQKQGPYTRLSATAKTLLCKTNIPVEYKAQNSHSMQIISMQKLLS